ncbi:MAG TPA: hypothetical protein VNQ76_16700 [Planctomicrobium sp.]|nr:hypothetical protein [Planctomicrobium sp.]
MSRTETQLKEEGAVISRTTILILSGVILSLSVVEDLDPFWFCAFSGGVVGLIAFIMLDLVAQKREVLRSLSGCRFVEERLERHLTTTIPLSVEAVQEQHALLDWLQRETRDLMR